MTDALMLAAVVLAFVSGLVMGATVERLTR